MFLISHFSLVSISCQLPGCLCASWAQRNVQKTMVFWTFLCFFSGFIVYVFFFLFTFSYQIQYSPCMDLPQKYTGCDCQSWLLPIKTVLGCIPVCSVPALAFHSMLFKIGLFLWELHYAVQERGKKQLDTEMGVYWNTGLLWETPLFSFEHHLTQVLIQMSD